MSVALPSHVLSARFDLMLRHPYLAAALARLPLVDGTDMGWCDTMATDGYHIFFNRDFCDRITNAEITGVFAHEVLHCVLGHIDRRGTRNRVVWNVAIDYATNLILRDFGFALPAGGLLNERYRNMTAEQIYDIVAEEIDLDNLPCNGFDVHIEPGDVEGQSLRGADFPSSEDRRRLRTWILREMQRHERFPGQGHAPGEFTHGVTLATRTQVTWQQLLSRFFNGLRRSDYRLFPFSKKHLWRGIYLPSMGVPGPDHLICAVDTSGSISNEMLGQFFAELDKLRGMTECKLTVIQCDATVQNVREFDGHEPTLFQRGTGPTVYGRGGTSFIPVFDWVRDRMRKGTPPPDALIYCTDGFGTFPPKSPPYPLVWIATATATPTFPFGQVIRLTD